MKAFQRPIYNVDSFRAFREVKQIKIVSLSLRLKYNQKL